MKKLIVIFIVAATAALSVNAQSHAGHNPNMTQTATQTAKHVMLKVQGNCDMCKVRIEKAATGVKGVSSAMWDSKKKELHLNYDSAKTTLETISKAIAKAGHDTEKHKADNKVYDALPNCCKYRS